MRNPQNLTKIILFYSFGNFTSVIELNGVINREGNHAEHDIDS